MERYPSKYAGLSHMPRRSRPGMCFCSPESGTSLVDGGKVKATLPSALDAELFALKDAITSVRLSFS